MFETLKIVHMHQHRPLHTNYYHHHHCPTGAQAAYKSSPGILILGQPLKLSSGVTSPLCFHLQTKVPGVSGWPYFLFPCPFQIRVWCVVRSLAFRGMSNPSPMSLEDLTISWVFFFMVCFQNSLLLMIKGQQIQGILLRQVLMIVWIFFRAVPGSPCFSFIAQDSFYSDVEDPDLDVHGHVKCAQMLFITNWKKVTLSCQFALSHQRQCLPPPLPPLPACK